MKVLDTADIDGNLTQEEIETGFTLLGATCVEDLLQHDVKRCLHDFKRAKIQCWMLTGDKGSTAKMIGVQCGMLSPLQDQIQQTATKDVKERGKEKVLLIEIDHDGVLNNQVTQQKIDELVQKCNQEFNGKKELLIDGNIFSKMLESEAKIEINQALK